jgi:hypothetical protein
MDNELTSITISGTVITRKDVMELNEMLMRGTKEEEQPAIDLDSFEADDLVIVLKKTGVIYTAQTGGLCCNHPTAEGYVLRSGNLAPSICHCICCSRLGIVQLVEHVQAAINRYIAENKLSVQIKFDYERINEFQEGWWPLLVKGKYFDIPFNDWTKIIYHSGNCD